MKASEIRKLSTEEIIEKLDEAREQLMRLRFQQVTGELVDTSQFRKTRRLIARLMTILREREIEAEKQSASEGEA
ncbi:MAG: 50S ribosomal protein L29 [Chloroflexi bacterium]|nr:50S ribosomal protein L29 [Chloroflexota bacterium]